MSKSGSNLLALVYVSSARRLFTEQELESLLRAARRKNRALGITGLLVYCGGNVLQVLEGPAAAVRALYAEIGGDPRHKDIHTIVELPIATRGFPDWAMAYGFCPTGDEFQGCVNLFRRDGKSLRGRLSDGNPLRSMVMCFIESNLPGIDTEIGNRGTDTRTSASPAR